MTAGTGKKRVLFVDDEPNILNALRRELFFWAEERDLVIEAATLAAEGLEMLGKTGNETIIVVSDLRMPGMKGSDFLLEVRRRYPDMITILLSGFSEAEELVKAVQAGIFSYVLKPWEAEYLQSEMTKAFEYQRTKAENKAYQLMIQDELKWAGEMQRAILRPNLPRCEGIEFRASYRPVSNLHCGGDYYDVIFLGSDRYLVLVGDVAGHGVRAALVTGILKAVVYSEYVRSTIGKAFSPGAFLGWLNERMNFELRSASNLLITFFAGVFDVKKGTLVYANAGQPHPLLRREGGIHKMPVTGSAIGFADAVLYADQTVSLRSGDIVDLYTDGLFEGVAATGGHSIPPESIYREVDFGPDYHRRILEQALRDAATEDFVDDVTLLTVRLP